MSIETQLPLPCPLFINGEEGSSSSKKKFHRENPADNRVTVTTAEEGTASDMRAATDAARDAFDKNTSNWLNNHKLRERVLYQTGELLRANAERLAAIVRLEVGMPASQAAGILPPPPTFSTFMQATPESFTAKPSSSPAAR